MAAAIDGNGSGAANRWKGPALVAVALLLGGLAAAGVWCERGLRSARTLAKHGLWSEARGAAARYLLLHPRDAEANLLVAEALAKDESLPAAARVDEAVERLRRVPDDDPRAAAARKAEARILLFLGRDAVRAERAVRRAVAADGDDAEAAYLLWRLLDLTRRHEDAEPCFRTVLAATPAAERGKVLRDWYLSQFYPVTATMDLDGLMGFRLTPADDATRVESNRLVGFRAAHPDSSTANAAMARWFQSNGDLSFALELLDGALAARPEEARSDPFFLGTLVDVLIDLGQAERAGEVLDGWPDGDRSRGYWLARGRVEQEVRDQPAEAARSYEEALRTWPGPIDWRTMHRAAGSHARAGDTERAAALRSRAGTLEGLLDEKVHAGLRKALVGLDNPESLRQVVDFYREIERPEESGAWTEFLETLPAVPDPTNERRGS